MSSWFISILLLLFLAHTFAANFCKGVTKITSLSGYIEDPIGGGNYQDKKICAWQISSPIPAQYMTITFVRFDLEYAYDFLIITSGSFNTKVTGYVLPNPLAVPVNSNTVTIQFSADDLITFKGFKLSFSFTNCSVNCVNGYCSNGTCACYLGYSGVNCSQTYCPNNCNCNGQQCNGQCVANKCSCSQNFQGVDCSQPAPTYCNGLTVLNGPNGTFGDHTPWYLPYKDNSKCQWSLRSGNPGAITLVLGLHQFEWYVDTLTVYDGADSSAPWLATSSTAGFAPLPVVSQRNTGDLYVTFTTSSITAYTGFVAEYWRNDLCPNSCSNNGYCIQGKCVCFSGKAGAGCDQDVQPLKITFNQSIVDYVGDFEWKFYSFTLVDPNNNGNIYPVSNLMIRYAKLDDQPPLSFDWKWGGGDLTFYVGYDYIPSLNTFTASAPYYGFPPYIFIPSPRTGTYNIGVFAKEAAYYSIFVVDPYHTPLPSGQTTGGPQYTSSSAGERKNSGLSVGAIVAIVIVIGSVLMIVVVSVGYFFYRRSRRNNNGFQVLDEHQQVNQFEIE